MTDTGIDADPDVEEMVALAELKQRYGVTEPQAEALLDHFGSADAVASAGHDELQEVHGIGPMTADTITPKSTRLRWIQDVIEPGMLIPTYTDHKGYARHWSERDRHPKREFDGDRYYR